MMNLETPEERKRQFKSLSSEERKIIIREKLIILNLLEGSGIKEKEKYSYDKKEIVDLI